MSMLTSRKRGQPRRNVRQTHMPEAQGAGFAITQTPGTPRIWSLHFATPDRLYALTLSEDQAQDFARFVQSHTDATRGGL